MNDIFQQIHNFTANHPKEIIIIDTRLVYTNKLTHETAIRLINEQVKTYFESRAILADQLNDYVIRDIWSKNISVIVFLANDKLSQKKTVESDHDLKIISPFDYNKFTQTSSWLHFLDLNYENRRFPHTTNSRAFYVTQGIMQPHWMEVVVAGISGKASLRVWVSEHATQKITDWLKGKQIGSGGINIVVADFVELYDFVDTVLKLNSITNIRSQATSISKSTIDICKIKHQTIVYQLIFIFFILRSV